MSKFVCSLTLLLILLSLNACKKPIESSEIPSSIIFRKDGTLTVTAPDGTVKGSFDIEIAETSDAVRQGLKYRETMADNQAMLFIFNDQQAHNFWMQDTYMPLDMLFIDERGKIFHIAENTVPFSEELVDSTGLNKYTLEVKAGTTQKLNLKTGDKIDWKRIK